MTHVQTWTVIYLFIYLFFFFIKLNSATLSIYLLLLVFICQTTGWHSPFFLQHFLHFLHVLHLHLQQNCKMPMVKRTPRIPKPTSTPTACEFAALPVNGVDSIRAAN